MSKTKMILSGLLVAVLSLAGFALAQAPSPAAQASCVKVFERQRSCTDTFIPALVDLRVSLDKPAGIAATAKSEGTDALISTALEEWKSDSTDAAIAKTCGRMPTPKADLGAKLEKCAGASSCTAFNECVIPLIGQTLKK